jgi:effector-binding domain-containing protein
MTDAPSTPEPQIRTLPAVDTAVVRGVVAPVDLPAFFDRSFGALGVALAELGTAPAGPAFAHYLRPPGDTSELEVGFPVGRRIEPSGDVVPSRLGGGRVATVVHDGGYEGLRTSWDRLLAWVEQQGLQPGVGMWEVYLTEPTPDGDPAANRTALFLPLQD